MKDPVSAVPLPPPESWQFTEELKKRPSSCFAPGSGMPSENILNLKGGVKLISQVPDPQKRLATAFEDLERFFNDTGIGKGELPVIARLADCGPNDSFEVQVTRESCILCGSGIEGVRRAVYYLEDLLSGNGGPWLQLGTLRKKAWVRQRISRCFFGPIKRPPFNRDELLDDVDYYPDAYLNQLAHEGVNGLWLTITFKDLCPTPLLPEYGKDAPRRLAKLRRTVEQCLRYGIKTYIFAIEPAAWNAEAPILEKYPELGGARHISGQICFCPSSEISQKYLYECTNHIFSAVPDLGGLINISYGERPTTCLSSLDPVKNWSQDPGLHVNCPRCGKLPKEEIIYNSLNAMAKGMHDAASQAELISWLYIPMPEETGDWIYTLDRLPEKCTALWNFESGGEEIQLGKKRVGGDYWLSYTGPSERFRRFAAKFPEGRKPGAKLQVGCSHELATVPYVPVPGQLYKKYRAMYEIGVDTVIQCWYFGNYPGLMNKAAGMLAFEDFSSSQQDFLTRLLKPEWGIYAPLLAETYEEFSDAYHLYPLSNAMQYFGPFHDGAVWPLYCHEQNIPLARTWQGIHPVSGDCIGEALENHTLDEAATLARMIKDKWSAAAEKLSVLREKFASSPERIRDLDLIRTLELHFIAAADIFRFYQLRRDNKEVTSEMKEILLREAALSRELAELCKKDPRLGFHSEAETYKYFPERLEVRAQMLEEELRSPLPFVKLPVLQDPLAPHKAENFTWQMKVEGEDLVFNIHLEGIFQLDQFFVTLRQDTTDFGVCCELNGQNRFLANRPGPTHEFRKGEKSWDAVFKLPMKLFRHKEGLFRLSLTRFARLNSTSLITCDPPAKERRPGWRLVIWTCEPGSMYLVDPEQLN